MADLRMKMNEDGNWEVEDYTSSDDSYRNSYFKTVWNDEYEMLEFYYDDKRSEHILDKSSHYDNRKCKLAVGRHQRHLLQQTGVIDNPADSAKQMFLLQKRSYSGYNPVTPIDTLEVIVTKKQLKSRHTNFNKHEVSYIEVTPEIHQLVDEYNEAIKEFTLTLKGLEVEIFGTRCGHCNEFSRQHKYRIDQEDWPKSVRKWRSTMLLCCDFCYNGFCKQNKIDKNPEHLIT